MPWWRCPDPLINPSTHPINLLQVARWVWRGLGRVAGATQPQQGLSSAGGGGETRVLALEYVEAVRLAAQLDMRVVLGDRDLPTTISRCVFGRAVVGCA